MESRGTLDVFALEGLSGRTRVDSRPRGTPDVFSLKDPLRGRDITEMQPGGTLDVFTLKDGFSGRGRVSDRGRAAQP